MWNNPYAMGQRGISGSEQIDVSVIMASASLVIENDRINNWTSIWNL